jgi:hypothetical protein
VVCADGVIGPPRLGDLPEKRDDDPLTVLEVADEGIEVGEDQAKGEDPGVGGPASSRPSSLRLARIRVMSSTGETICSCNRLAPPTGNAAVSRIERVLLLELTEDVVPYRGALDRPLTLPASAWSSSMGWSNGVGGSGAHDDDADDDVVGPPSEVIELATDETLGLDRRTRPRLSLRDLDGRSRLDPSSSTVSGAGGVLKTYAGREMTVAAEDGEPSGLKVSELKLERGRSATLAEGASKLAERTSLIHCGTPVVLGWSCEVGRIGSEPTVMEGEGRASCRSFGQSEARTSGEGLRALSAI